MRERKGGEAIRRAILICPRRPELNAATRYGSKQLTHRSQLVVPGSGRARWSRADSIRWTMYSKVHLILSASSGLMSFKPSRSASPALHLADRELTECITVWRI